MNEKILIPKDMEKESLNTLNIYQAEQAIDAFNRLPFNKGQRKSFIDIMGVSHLESVSSKTLAFFLNTQEEHKLNDLVISALFDVIGESFLYQIHTQKVILEKRIEQGGRLDFWVETNDHIIVIENKIKHHTNNNPFADYVSHAQVNNPKNKKLIFILLVIQEPESPPHNFKVIKHFDLSKQILKGLGQKTLQADQYYLTYLIDYISAIEKFNPYSEYSKMQMEVVNFYRKNSKILESIEDEANKESVYQYYEQKVREIIVMLRDYKLDIFPDDAEFNKYEGDLSSIGGSLNSKTLESQKYDYKIEFEVYASTSFTNLWCRRFKGKNMNKQDSIDLQTLLKSKKISFQEQDDHNDILLLEEGESISVEDFVNKATPIIKQILSQCGMESY
ncbi:PD-(D/E)XK nuclease family protein [Acinetobacter sp. YH12236]|uniref:PD-(D/E)XK nuclease family protein n=1 Tax=Acinetobacter sp. YH12236 TaxID=2601163 RepID=UPI0015D12B03|nr:PD-(D/E)XK nuclease family protein [Acinetobacter sp. YH12236]